jgi:Immunoglobulin-like domain of bacterial spore germination
MKRFPILLTIPGLVLLAACGGDHEASTTASPSGSGVTSLTATASPSRSAVTSPTVTASSPPSATPVDLTNVCGDNPDPATSDVNQVDIPNAGDEVASGFVVEGRILAFEATFRITIFDAAGNTIADQTAMSSEGQTLAPFSEVVAYSVTQDTPACLWVYENSARDGSPIHVRQIPLLLLQ